MICSLIDCQKIINPSLDSRVEVKTTLSEKRKLTTKQKPVINWSKTGDAVFDSGCWDKIVTAAKSGRSKQSQLSLTTDDKRLIKDALETAEYHDSFSVLRREAARVVELIKGSHYCVAFTGAGISTSAGIGDYRGKDGKWTEEDRKVSRGNGILPEPEEPSKKKVKLDPESENSIIDACESEEGVQYENLRPTYTHEALAKLVQDGHLKHVISQNGDGLHGLSGISSSNLSELHGNVFLEKCPKCKTQYERSYYVMDDDASAYYEELEDNGKTSIAKPKHAIKCRRCGLCHRTGRRCEKKGCTGFLNDTIINFRDLLDSHILKHAELNAGLSDLMLCLGTTLQVTPANSLVEMAQKPLRLVICNRQTTPLDSICTAVPPNSDVESIPTGRTRAKSKKKQIADKTTEPRDLPESLGARVFGDCDVFMKELMTGVLTSEDLNTWESARSTRMLEYNKKR